MNKSDHKTEYYNRVKDYIVMEYGDELADKMQVGKFKNISDGYINNCFSLKKPIPYAANNLVKYLKETV